MSRRYGHDPTGMAAGPSSTSAERLAQFVGDSKGRHSVSSTSLSSLQQDISGTSHHDRSGRHASPTRARTARSVSPVKSYIDRPKTPSRRNHVHADRYIPMREGSEAQSAAFQLMEGEPASPSRHKRKLAPDMDAAREDANGTFSALIGNEIFGSDVRGMNGHMTSSSSSAPSSGGSSSRPSLTTPTTPTKKNLFSYSSPRSGRRGSAVAQDDTTLRRGSSGPSTPRRTDSGGQVGGSGSLFGSAKRGAADGLGASPSSSPSHKAYDTSPVKQESQRMLLSPRRPARTVSKVPFKVLDAPDLADDFYLNLVDWSPNNTLGVGLNECVYLWSARDSNVEKLVDLKDEGDKVTSLSWAGRGNHIAVGTQTGLVKIYDAERLKLLRTMQGHTNRVGSLAWNEHILTSGSRDRMIYHRDVRVPEQHIRELRGHRQEVCGLKWNTETNQLASGGNDNKLFIWDSLTSTPLHRFSEHTAAVKAIAWSPHQQGLLASGGGTADMKIRFWNTINGSLLSEVDTGSQVCNLMWSRTANEVVSTHGYSAGKIQNQIQVWRYPSMQQIATLTGHTMRVLYLAMSPDGDTIVTGAGDETLRFWDLNTPSVKRDAIQQKGVLSPFAKLR